MIVFPAKRLHFQKDGFTLIELLVTVTIATLLVGGAIAGYVRYNTQSAISQSANDLMTVLRTAQTRATVGDKPAGCTSPLTGYEVVGTKGNATYNLNAICSNNAHLLVSTYTMKGTTVLDSNVNIGYQILTGVPNPPLTGGANADSVDIYLGETGASGMGCQLIQPKQSGGIVYTTTFTAPCP